MGFILFNAIDFTVGKPVFIELCRVCSLFIKQITNLIFLQTVFSVGVTNLWSYLCFCYTTVLIRMLQRFLNYMNIVGVI